MMLTIYIARETLWGPQDHPRFDDLPGGRPGLSIQSYSQLRFITVKGYRTKSAQGKGT